jgi:hypothetical protein
MAATILNSPRAIEMSVYVVRAFVQLREMLASNKELARRFAQLETRLDKKLTIHEAIAAIGAARSRQPTAALPSRCISVRFLSCAKIGTLHGHDADRGASYPSWNRTGQFRRILNWPNGSSAI